jgi:hypothetical protein
MTKIEAAKRLQVTAAGIHDTLPGPCKVYFADHEPLDFKSVSAKGKWEFSKECRNLGSGSHMRIGHYSVITFPRNFEVGVSKDYAAALFETDQALKPDSEFWDRHVKDRTRQLKEAAAALKECNHPLLKDVMKDIRAELKYYKDNS